MQAGIHVVLHDEHFKDPKTPDHVWVKEIGQRGWIMVTCDAATMRCPLFLRALRRSTARVFILDEMEGVSLEAKAECVIRRYDQMLSICEKREPPSFWRCNRGGQFVVVNIQQKWTNLRRAGRT